MYLLEVMAKENSIFLGKNLILWYNVVGIPGTSLRKIKHGGVQPDQEKRENRELKFQTGRIILQWGHSNRENLTFFVNCFSDKRMRALHINKSI